MYITLGTIFTLISMAYCYNKMKTIKLIDFEKEDIELQQYENKNLKLNPVKCEELRISDKFSFKSDNSIMIIISFIISSLYVYLNSSTLLTVFFTPIIPILISLFITDIRLKRLPNYFTYKIAILGTIAIITSMFLTGNYQLILNNIFNAIILFILYFIMAMLTGGALGGGDVKLIGAIGLFFPMEYMPQFLMYPFILGALQGVYLMIIKKKKLNDFFAFAPSIIISILIIAFM